MSYITNPKMPYDEINSFVGEKYAVIYCNTKLNTNLKLIKGRVESKGNCFNYVTKNYYLECCEDAMEYINLNYKEINIADIKIGNIIAFFDSYSKCEEISIQHFGKIIRTDNTISGTIIRSKWGQGGIFEGNINDLPDIYGDKVKFYRKKTLKRTLKRPIKRNIF